MFTSRAFVASFLLLLVASTATATTIVGGWEVIDDSSSPNALGSFTTNGFVNFANPGDTPRDWNGTAAYASNGTSGDTATYTFNNLKPGYYEIATSISDLYNRRPTQPTPSTAARTFMSTRRFRPRAGRS